MGDVIQFPAKGPRALSECDVRAVIRENVGLLGAEFDRLRSLDMTENEWVACVSHVLSRYRHILASIVTRGAGLSLLQAAELTTFERIRLAAEIVNLTKAAHHPASIGYWLIEELVPTSITAHRMYYSEPGAA